MWADSIGDTRVTVEKPGEYCLSGSQDPGKGQWTRGCSGGRFLFENPDEDGFPSPLNWVDGWIFFLFSSIALASEGPSVQ